MESHHNYKRLDGKNVGGPAKTNCECEMCENKRNNANTQYRAEYSGFSNLKSDNEYMQQHLASLGEKNTFEDE